MSPLGEPERVLVSLVTCAQKELRRGRTFHSQLGCQCPAVNKIPGGYGEGSPSFQIFEKKKEGSPAEG